MEQFKQIVLEAPEGMHYTTSQGENGELIIRLVPNSPETSQRYVNYSESTEVEESTDKAKYFIKISGEDRKKVKMWLAKQKGKTKREKRFLEVVKDAVQKVNYDYWIATIEPSVANGKIYYAKGENVGVGFSSNQWYEMAKAYAPERGSRQSNLKELFMWYALRIAKGFWTLDYVANDSSSAGNYWNEPNSAKSMEKTCERVCCGHLDGQGNTYKIVTDEDGFAFVGGDYDRNGFNYPVSYVFYYLYPDDTLYYGSGVLVLTK